MGDRAHHQNGHGAIDRVERIVGVVEKENIGQPQNHARDRHWQHRQKLKSPAPEGKTLGFFDHIGAGEDDHGADQRGQQPELD